jgi:hypothetical protein
VFLSRPGRFIFAFLFASLDLEKKSALTALSWGLWVIAARSFDSSPAYVYLIRAARWFPLGPEAFWGGLMTLAGSLQLYGLVYRQTVLRMGSALFASTLWLSLGLAFAIHNPRGGGMIIYGLFSLANAALYFQVGTARR